MENLKKQILNFAELHYDYIKKARGHMDDAESSIAAARKAIEDAEEIMEYVVTCVEDFSGSNAD